MCHKTEADFWEATYREIDIAIQAALQFEQDHDLPMMALQATWNAIQQRSEKMLDIDDLLGKGKGSRGPMSKTEMVSNMYWVHEKAVELQKKKEEEAKLREEQPDDVGR